MKRSTKLSAGLAVTLLLATTANAQMGGGGGKPPAPDFSKMASELGVSESAVEACFPKPAKSAGQPERPDMSKVASCIQKSNASLSESQIEQVLKDNAPKPPKRG